MTGGGAAKGVFQAAGMVGFGTIAPPIVGFLCLSGFFFHSVRNWKVRARVSPAWNDDETHHIAQAPLPSCR